MFLNKSLITTLLKVAFVVVIFAFLFSSGKFDLAHFNPERIDWSFVRLGFVMVALSMCLLMLRYWYVVRRLNIKIGLWECLKIGSIAFFFTNCAFGALSGEFVRATYTAPFADKKSHVLSGIMFDRFVGVLSLSTLCVIGLALNKSALNMPWFHVVMGVVFLFFSFAWQALFSLCFIRYLGHRMGATASYAFMVVLGCFGLMLFAQRNGYYGQTAGVYVGVAMLLAYVVYTTILIAMIRKIDSQLSGQAQIPPNVRRTYISKVESVLRACVLFIGRPQVLVTTFAMALFAHFLYVLALLFICMALSGGGDFHLVEGVLAAPLTFLMNLFPFPGAGAGVNEASYGYFMGRLAGVDTSIAVGSYFLFRCILIGLSLIGVPLFFLRNKTIAKSAVEDEKC